MWLLTDPIIISRIPMTINCREHSKKRGFMLSFIVSADASDGPESPDAAVVKTLRAVGDAAVH